MKDEFEDLFDYNNHFNSALIALISENLSTVSEKTMKLMNHIVNAHQIWNARIKGEKTFGVWQMNQWSDLQAIHDANYAKTLEIIAARDLGSVLKYATSNGSQFSNKVKDILFHVINHSTYHRAQIATELKNCGIEPIMTDYIFYKRQID